MADREDGPIAWSSTEFDQFVANLGRKLGILSRHLLYRFVLRWRGTVLLSLLLGPLPVIGLLGLLFGSAGGMFEILALPIDFVAHQNWTHRITFSLPVLFSIVILSMAHPLKTCLTNAIITAIGISLWYGLAFHIGASAG